MEYFRYASVILLEKLFQHETGNQLMPYNQSWQMKK